MKKKSFEFDVNDFLLVPKSIMRDVLELYTPDHFHPEVKERSFEASILYKQAFDHGQQYEYESNAILNPGTALQESELYAFYHTEKFNILCDQ